MRVSEQSIPRWIYRVVLCGALAMLVGCGTAAAPTPQVFPRPVPTAAELDVPGSLLIPLDNKLVAIELKTRARRTLVELPTTSYISGPAVSPDGRKIAFAVYQQPADPKDPGGADLFLFESGGAPSLLLAHGASGTSLGEPAWAPDGSAVYYSRQEAKIEGGRVRSVSRSVARVGIDGSGQQVTRQDAESPAVSSDGRMLAYLTRPEASVSNALWVIADGDQQPRQISGANFAAIRAPRFKPGGTQIMFAAVSSQAGKTSISKSDGGVLGAVLGLGIAEAHGTPWDIWQVDADGRNLIRLTDVGEDMPIPAWSPDGSWLAFAGELGVYLTNLADKRTVKLSDDYVGGIAWLPQ